MKKNFLKLAAFAVLTTALVTACGGGGDDKPKIDPFEALRNNPDVNKTAWYNSMAVLCAAEGDPRVGCNFHYDGTKVTLQSDPHYAKLNGFLFTRVAFSDFYYVEEDSNSCLSYNPVGFCEEYEQRTVKKNFTNYTYFVKTPDGYTLDMKYWASNAHFYTDTLGGWSIAHKVGSGSAIDNITLTSPAGIKYNFEGAALNATILAGESAEGDDLLGSVAEQKADQIEGVAQQLGAKFQLDADVSLKAAKALSDWSEIGSRRARTRADLAAFSKDVYGVELDKVEQAALLFHEGKLEQGLTEMNTLVDTAAKNWKTTPETMREVLSYFYGDL